MNKGLKRFLASNLALSVIFINLRIPVFAKEHVSNDNVALNSTVVEGTNAENGSTYDNVVDGDKSNEFNARLSSNRNTKPTVILDLGSEKKIQFLRLFLEDRKNVQYKNNVKKYRITFSLDKNFEENDSRVERELNTETIRDDVKLSKAVNTRYIKLEIIETHKDNMWDNAGIVELELYKNTLNQSIGANASGENSEGHGNTYDKAIDGDYETRLASTQNTMPILKLDLGKEKNIDNFHLFLEKRGQAPLNNVKKYKVTVSKDNTFDESDPSITRELDNQTTYDSTGFEKPVLGQYVKLEVLETHKAAWDNGGIVEFELYDHPFTVVTLDEGPTIESVRPVYNAETNKIVVSEVPGYTIENNGADFEQIVDNNFNVHKPLTSKTVKISLKITNNNTKEVTITNDFEVVIPGLHEANKGNQKPVVSPELAEWYSSDNKLFTTNENSKIVVNPEYKNNLEYAANEFKKDYEDMTGRKISISYDKDNVGVGDFYFTLGSEDNLLGDEGYNMEITDKVIVEAKHKIGAYWSTRSILQILTQSKNNNTMPCGITRDYPKYKVRGFVLDVARKPFSMDMLKDITKNMAWHKMNDFQVHLSDNYIWLEDYGVGETENEAFKAYDAFRLESNVKNSKNESATAKDYAYSKEEFKQFINESRKIGVNIVPEIDIPAHANSFTKVFPEIMVKNKRSPLANNRPLIDHIDVSKPESIKKVKEIFDEYTKGDNPTFDSETVVHIGADEFLANYKAYRNFINEFVPYIKNTNPVRMWGGLTWIKDNPVTEIKPEAIENVQMNLWSRDWADGKEMYDMGYKLINTIDSYMYMVPNGNGGRGAYGDYLNTNSLYSNFEPNIVSTKSGWKAIPSGDDQALGAAFAIWNDNIDKRASGLTESDMYERFQDALPIVAEKTWANGKEKGSLENLQNASKNVGLSPNTNPLFKENSINDQYANYTFEKKNELEDSSENNRDLSNLTNASFKTGKTSNAISLEGNKSFIEMPLDKLGKGNELSFDLRLEEAAPGQILFESDSSYGTHDIRIMENGVLGFTRELYDYTFDYVLPVKEWVNIAIKTENQNTTLYVNGEMVASAKGKFVHNNMIKKSNITDSTFALSLERIGSMTNSIKGKIDNIIIKKSGEDKNKIPNKEISVTASSQYTGEGPENLLDGNKNTIWHSNWADNNVKLPQELIFTFEKPTEISKLSYIPRQNGTANGNIMEFDLYATDENGKETKVLDAKAWSGDSSTKFAKFDAVKAKTIRMVINKSNGDTKNKFASGAEMSFYSPSGDIDSGVNKKALQEAIDKAKNINSEDYTTSSFNQEVLNNAIKAAEELVSKDNIGQDDIENAINELENIISKFVKRGSVEELTEYLKSCESETSEKYTEESWTIFEKALERAKDLISSDNRDLTQEDVDSVLEALKAAKEGLIEKMESGKDEKPGETEKPSETEKPTKGEDVPRTGDINNLGLLASIFTASGLGLVFLRNKRKE